MEAENSWRSCVYEAFPVGAQSEDHFKISILDHNHESMSCEYFILQAIQYPPTVQYQIQIQDEQYFQDPCVCECSDMDLVIENTVLCPFESSTEPEIPKPPQSLLKLDGEITPENLDEDLKQDADTLTISFEEFNYQVKSIPKVTVDEKPMDSGGQEKDGSLCVQPGPLNPGFPCRICGKPFKKQKSSEIHAYSHMNGEELEKAGQSNGSHFLKNQENSKQRVTRPPKGKLIFSCPVSEQTFSGQRKMARHRDTHHKEVTLLPKFPCTVCKKSFKSRTSLKAHTKNFHTERGVFQCTKCNKIYDSYTELILHKKSHFPCYFCPVKSSSLGAMYKHMGMHTKEKHLQCPKCPKEFRSVSHLNNHLVETHEKIRNFSCFRCGKKFGRKANLLRHIKTVHANAEPVKIQWSVKH